MRPPPDSDGEPDMPSRHGSLGGARGGLACRSGAAGGWRGALRWLHVGPGRLISDDAGWHRHQRRRSAVVISVVRAESGAASVVLGTLAAPGGSGNGKGALSASAIEVATSRDGGRRPTRALGRGHRRGRLPASPRDHGRDGASRRGTGRADSGSPHAAVEPHDTQNTSAGVVLCARELALGDAVTPEW